MQNSLGSMMVPHLTAVFAALALLWFGFVVKTYFEKRAFIKQHGCKPVRKFPQRESLIGYDLYKSQLMAAKQRRILRTAVERFERFGKTLEFTLLGRSIISTIEPENIKTVLATSFKDYGLGQRQRAFGPLLGQGIFTTDGAQWEHSRVCHLLFVFAYN